MSSNIRVNSITPSVGNSVAIGTAGGSVVFQCDTINFSGTSGVTNFTKDISVDGHTELDNVNISGVVTATSFVGPLTGNVTGNVTGNLTGNVTGNTSGTAGGLSGSPSITVTDITSSGNVSIAGTLTYEDVTNVDSIGIVTAKSGIHVTGGSVGIGTDNPDYGLHVFGAGDILIEDSGNGSAHLRLRSSNNGTDVSNWKVKTSSNNFLYIENDTVGGVPAFTIDNSAKIGIKDATPSVSLDLASTTDAIALPQGTTAQRPTGSAPYIRKNSTNNALEFYNGTNWVEIITDYFPTGSTTLG